MPDLTPVAGYTHDLTIEYGSPTFPTKVGLMLPGSDLTKFSKELYTPFAPATRQGNATIKDFGVATVWELSADWSGGVGKLQESLVESTGYASARGNNITGGLGTTLFTAQKGRLLPAPASVAAGTLTNIKQFILFGGAWYALTSDAAGKVYKYDATGVTPSLVETLTAAGTQLFTDGATLYACQGASNAVRKTTDGASWSNHTFNANYIAARADGTLAYISGATLTPGGTYTATAIGLTGTVATGLLFQFGALWIGKPEGLYTWIEVTGGTTGTIDRRFDTMQMQRATNFDKMVSSRDLVYFNVGNRLFYTEGKRYVEILPADLAGFSAIYSMTSYDNKLLVGAKLKPKEGMSYVTAATSGGTFADETSAGDAVWTDPGNVATSNNSRASVAIGLQNTAATSGGTFADDAAGGTIAWDDPSNAAASDNARASVVLVAVSAHSEVTSPGTMADDSAVGDSTWADPNNAKTSNDAYATVSAGMVSHYLKATNLSNALPAGAVVTGVKVEIEKHADNTGDFTTTDFGNNWSLVKSIATYEFRSIVNLGGGVVLAGTYETGSIYKSTDSGATWALVQQLGSETFVWSLASLGSGVVLAGTGPTGDIYKSTDSGATWSLIGRLGSETAIYSLVSLGSGVVLAGTYPTGDIYKSTDSGATWALIGRLGSETEVYSLVSLGSGVVLAGTGSTGDIYKSTDSGATWALIQRLGSETRVHCLVSLGSGVVLAGTESTGDVYKSTDSGATWSLIQRLGSETMVASLVSLGSGIVLAGTGSTGKIYKSTDSGATWTLIQRLGTQQFVLSLVSLGSGTVLAATGWPTGQIYKSTTAYPITSTINDTTVKLVKGGAVVGDNKADAANWPGADAYTTYGGAADLWGTTLTVSDVNANNFGVVVSATRGNGAKSYVDHIRITVYYTAPATGTSHYLKITNFGFAIPTGATVTGIKVEAEGYSTDAVTTLRVYPVKGGAIEASHTDITLPTSEVYTTIGGNSALFGEVWTPAQINSSTFGLALVATNDALMTTQTAYIDPVQITIYYAVATSHYLKATNFGFAIPSNATITGIKVEAEGYATDAVTTLRAYAVKAGTIGATALSVLLPTSEAYGTMGGNGSLFSDTWTPAQINAATWGIALVAANASYTAGQTAYLDHARVTVYYTTPSAENNFLLLYDNPGNPGLNPLWSDADGTNPIYAIGVTSLYDTTQSRVYFCTNNANANTRYIDLNERMIPKTYDTGASLISYLDFTDFSSGFRTVPKWYYEVVLTVDNPNLTTFARVDYSIDGSDFRQCVDENGTAVELTLSARTVGCYLPLATTGLWCDLRVYTRTTTTTNPTSVTTLTLRGAVRVKPRYQIQFPINCAPTVATRQGNSDSGAVIKNHIRNAAAQIQPVKLTDWEGNVYLVLFREPSPFEAVSQHRISDTGPLEVYPVIQCVMTAIDAMTAAGNYPAWTAG
jgi:photosystem II stability/assembly factor-like uncharacterized protein